MISASINGSKIMRRKSNRERPLKAIFQIFRCPTKLFLGPNIDETYLSGTVIVMLQLPFAAGRATDCSDINNVRIIRFDHNKAAFSSSRQSAFLKRDCSVCAGTRNADAGVVLLSGIDAIRELIVGVNSVKLSGKLVVYSGPCFSAVVRNTTSTVIALHHTLRIFRVNPKVVIVSVRSGNFAEISTTIGRFPHLQISNINRIGVFWICENVAVIPGTVNQIPVSGSFNPAFSAVVRAV